MQLMQHSTRAPLQPHLNSPHATPLRVSSVSPSTNKCAPAAPQATSTLHGMRRQRPPGYPPLYSWKALPYVLLWPNCDWNRLVYRLVLEGGALPLNVLGQRVEEWAAAVAKKCAVE